MSDDHTEALRLARIISGDRTVDGNGQWSALDAVAVARALLALDERVKGFEADLAMNQENARAALARAEVAEQRVRELEGALREIADKRPNRSFDPWAVDIARRALVKTEVTGRSPRRARTNEEARQLGYDSLDSYLQDLYDGDPFDKLAGE